MKQTCPGYRDPSGLIFRDESSQVIDKARSRVNKRASASSTSSSTNQRPSSAEPARPQTSTSDVTSTPRVATVEELLADSGNNAIFSSGSFDLDMLGFLSPFGADDGLFSMQQDGSDSIMAAAGSTASSSIGPAMDDLPRRTSADDRSGGQDYSGNDGGNMQLQQQHPHQQQQQHSESVSRPFSLPLDMIGLNYFLSHYVVRQSGPCSGFLDYTFTILSREDGNDLLEGAILALGFSGLAHTTRQGDLMARSIMMYTRTMERVNRALADPLAARRDSTIATVMILSLYDFAKQSLEGWKLHIEGATSLLTLRGKSQFSHPVGLQIFKDVFSQLLINCLRVGQPMPGGLRMLRIEAAKAISVSDPYWIASSAMVELLDLYQHISPGGYSYVSNSNNSSNFTVPTSSPTSAPSKQPHMPVHDLERFLSQALEIDHRLESSFTEVPLEWQYTVMPASPSSLDSSRVIGDAQHIYPDICVANVWNSMRTCRILANHAIGHLLLRGANTDTNWFFSNNYAERLQQVTKNMGRLRDELIASVPQHMGYINSPSQQQKSQQQQQQQRMNSGSTPVATSDSGIDIGDNSSSSSPSYFPATMFYGDQITYSGSAIGGYFACWVLLMIGCMHNLTDETRAWTVAQLRRVSSQNGLTQADHFATAIETNNFRPPLR